MGFFDGIITKKVQPSERAKLTAEREENELLAYRYVRNTLDRGAIQYNATGGTEELSKVLSGDYLLAFTEVLDQYLAHGLRWDFSTRFRAADDPFSSNSVAEIIDEVMTPDGQVQSFTVREYYTDRGRASGLNDNKVIHESDGARLGLVVTIEYAGETRYRVSKLSVIPGV